MATIAENLQTLNETKQAIKTAIEDKGQDLTDIPFTAYAQKIAEIKSGGGGVEMTSGTVTYDNSDYTFSIAHGLSKTPKVFLFFKEEFPNLIGVNVFAGITYFEYGGKVAISWRQQSMSSLNLVTNEVSVNGVIAVGQARITVDDTKMEYKNGTMKPSGTYYWEAYTW